MTVMTIGEFITGPNLPVQINAFPTQPNLDMRTPQDVSGASTASASPRNPSVRAVAAAWARATVG